MAISTVYASIGGLPRRAKALLAMTMFWCVRRGRLFGSSLLRRGHVGVGQEELGFFAFHRPLEGGAGDLLGVVDTVVEGLVEACGNITLLIEDF